MGVQLEVLLVVTRRPGLPVVNISTGRNVERAVWVRDLASTRIRRWQACTSMWWSSQSESSHQQHRHRFSYLPPFIYTVSCTHVHTQWSGSEIIVQGKLEADQQAVCAQLAQSLPIVVHGQGLWTPHRKGTALSYLLIATLKKLTHNFSKL